VNALPAAEDTEMPPPIAQMCRPMLSVISGFSTMGMGVSLPFLPIGASPERHAAAGTASAELAFRSRLFARASGNRPH